MRALVGDLSSGKEESVASETDGGKGQTRTLKARHNCAVSRSAGVMRRGRDSGSVTDAE